MTSPLSAIARNSEQRDDMADAGSVANDKIRAILSACRSKDVQTLCGLATEPLGLINDSLRRTAWPIILGCHINESETVEGITYDKHTDEDQVKLDVDRSFVYYPNNESELRIEHRKAELQDLIIQTLRKYRYLSYFQGFHDIVQVFLLVLGGDAALPVSRLALLHIRDFMLPTMAGAIDHLQLLPDILQAADLSLARHLSRTQPFFALASTLTLYAHEIPEYSDIARLFDFLLAQEAVVPMYLFAVIVCSRKTEILEIGPDDSDLLHSILSRLPNPLDLEHLILETMKLFKRCPPEKLPSWKWFRISRCSVLKTTRNRTDLAQQTMEDGEKFFQRQVAQLRLNQVISRSWTTIARLKRPTGAFGFAIIVVVVSWWLNRKGWTSALLARGIW